MASFCNAAGSYLRLFQATKLCYGFRASSVAGHGAVPYHVCLMQIMVIPIMLSLLGNKSCFNEGFLLVWL